MIPLMKLESGEMQRESNAEMPGYREPIIPPIIVQTHLSQTNLIAISDPGVVCSHTIFPLPEP